MMDSSSARWTGLSQMGRGFPNITIFTRSVAAASIAANIVILGDMQNGAVWCSFSMMPS